MWLRWRRIWFGSGALDGIRGRGWSKLVKALFGELDRIYRMQDGEGLAFKRFGAVGTDRTSGPAEASGFVTFWCHCAVTGLVFCNFHPRLAV